MGAAAPASPKRRQSSIGQTPAAGKPRRLPDHRNDRMMIRSALSNSAGSMFRLLVLLLPIAAALPAGAALPDGAPASSSARPASGVAAFWTTHRDERWQAPAALAQVRGAPSQQAGSPAPQGRPVGPPAHAGQWSATPQPPGSWNPQPPAVRHPYPPPHLHPPRQQPQLLDPGPGGFPNPPRAYPTPPRQYPSPMRPWPPGESN